MYAKKSIYLCFWVVNEESDSSLRTLVLLGIWIKKHHSAEKFKKAFMYKRLKSGLSLVVVRAEQTCFKTTFWGFSVKNEELKLSFKSYRRIWIANIDFRLNFGKLYCCKEQFYVAIMRFRRKISKMNFC